MQRSFGEDATFARRALLGGTAAALAGCSLRRRLASTEASVTTRVPRRPFTLGVASGDPAPEGVVLWTRLAPDPLDGGGMPAPSVEVVWEVADDERMEHVVRRGVALARAALAHSVHVEVDGLAPGRWYHYRFRVGGEASPIGRTRTALAPGDRTDRVAFAVASCQSWQAGWYTAYEHMCREDLDLVVHLGDYVYEGGLSLGGVRRHDGFFEVHSLEGYRNRHALYRSDPLLQAAHAAFPWALTWDDHEVDNDYAGDASEDGVATREFLRRRAAAYQAYYEHMPLRLTAAPRGPDMLLYRRIAIGDLLALHVLDTRQYRTGGARRGDWGDASAARGARALSMIGPRQERWLEDGLARSAARWNALAQGLFVARRAVRRPGTDEDIYNLDAWDGFPESRRRLLDLFARHRPANPVLLSGDVHASWVADLKADFDDPRAPALATEFVGTSLTSGGDGAPMNEGAAATLARNPHLRFFNGQRGYLRCLLTPERWQTDLRVVPYVTRPGAPIHTAASFVVEDGRPGAQRA